MKKLTASLLILLFVGCKSKNNNVPEIKKKLLGDTINSTQADISVINVEGCYLQILQRDSFTASLQQQGNILTGKLSFNNYEKDKNSGTVTGKLNGQILKLWYNFNSEGMKSVMEVYFKKEGNKLIRGTSDMGTKGDTSFFLNKDAIKYESGALKKIPCNELPVKYK